MACVVGKAHRRPFVTLGCAGSVHREEMLDASVVVDARDRFGQRRAIGAALATHGRPSKDPVGAGHAALAEPLAVVTAEKLTVVHVEIAHRVDGVQGLACALPASGALLGEQRHHGVLCRDGLGCPRDRCLLVEPAVSSAPAHECLAKGDDDGILAPHAQNRQRRLAPPAAVAAHARRWGVVWHDRSGETARHLDTRATDQVRDRGVADGMRHEREARAVDGRDKGLIVRHERGVVRGALEKRAAPR